jgi:hypothetical protein
MDKSDLAPEQDLNRLKFKNINLHGLPHLRLNVANRLLKIRRFLHYQKIKTLVISLSLLCSAKLRYKLRERVLSIQDAVMTKFPQKYELFNHTVCIKTIEIYTVPRVTADREK